MDIRLATTLILITLIKVSRQSCRSVNVVQRYFPAFTHQRPSLKKYIECQDITINSGFYKNIEPLFVQTQTQWLEINSTDNPEIASGAFSTLSMLPDLRINGGSIHVIQPGAFNGLSNLTQLSLKNNKISTLYENCFKNLSNLLGLDLGFNNIREINGKCFVGLKKLRSLLLNNNYLSEPSPLSPLLFQELTSLESLDLSFNKLVSIDNRLFKKLYNLTNVWLNNNNLYRFDGDLLSNNFYLRNLYINNNYITYLANLSFPNSIIAVNVSHNLIHSLNFVRFAEIKLFDLSANSIQSLTTDSFKNVSLQELYLDQNYLGLNTIDGAIFSNLSTLEIISLGNNRIEKLPLNLFANNTKLRKLSLAQNNLRFINCTKFPISLQELNLNSNSLDSNLNISNLINLKYVDLSFNNLSQLPFHFLGGLKWLSKLSLCYNKLAKIYIGCFKDLTMLRDLDLSNNNISSLEIGIFVGLDNLDRLNISGNKLNTLNEGVFHNLMKMRVLNFAYNNISFFSVENTLTHLSSLREIGLAGNDWSCQLLTSIIKEYPRVKFIRGDDFNVTNVNGIRCKYEMKDPIDLIDLHSNILSVIASKLNTINNLLFLILTFLLLKLVLKYVSGCFKKDKLKTGKSEQELQLI